MTRSSNEQSHDRWRGALDGRVIAVTGASGFIGTHLVRRLATVDCRVVRVSTREEPAWSAVGAADIVFHLGAQTSATIADADPDADFAANVVPMQKLVRACRHSPNRAVVVFTGTVTQAGIPASVPVNEDAVDQPITAYDRHKLAAERHLEAAARDGAVDGVTLRLSNVYGPRFGASNNDRDVLNRMIAAAVAGEALTVYGAGSRIRDYVFVDDVIDALLMAAAHAHAITARHFVIGSGHGISIRDAFELIASRVALRTGRAVEVLTADVAAPTHSIQHRDFIADPSRFATATGWRPNVTLLEGIDRTIEAYQCALS